MIKFGQVVDLNNGFHGRTIWEFQSGRLDRSFAKFKNPSAASTDQTARWIVGERNSGDFAMLGREGETQLAPKGPLGGRSWAKITSS